MDARQHIEAGESELDIADTKPTYSEASAQHVARAHAHFAAATAYLLLETQPEELTGSLFGEHEALPHSRACGIALHGHGTDCARDCPTCAGGRVPTHHYPKP